MAEVIIERDLVSRNVKIYVGDRDGYLVDKGPAELGYRIIERVPTARHERAEPYLVIDAETFESIVREAVREMHPEDATVDALKDARAVRDRLLTLIESHAGGL